MDGRPTVTDLAFVMNAKALSIMRYHDDINIEHNMKSICRVAVAQWTLAQPRGQPGICPPPPGLRQALGRECTHQADQGENDNLQLQSSQNSNITVLGNLYYYLYQYIYISVNCCHCDYVFLKDVLSVIKKELNWNFQFSRFLGQSVENGINF